jgi:hypothetical protein
MLKIYSAVSTEVTEDDFYFPFDPATNMTPGYVPCLHRPLSFRPHDSSLS